MYTKQALRDLGVTSATLTDMQKKQLDEQGFFTVENVLSAAELAGMRAEFERIHGAEREQGGHEVHVEPGARRLSNIFNKTAAFDRCLEIPEVLAASAYLLGEIKVHGANLRDPVKGHGQQDLHVDVPKKFADDWWVVNAMLMLDDMTLDNGPTRVVPGSHHWAPINVPYVNQGDWEPAPLSAEDQARVPADLGAPYPGEVLVTAPARLGDHLQLLDVAQRDREEGRFAPAHAASDLHPPRPAAAAGAARSPDPGPLRPHEPGAPLPARDRAAARGRGAAAPAQA